MFIFCHRDDFLCLALLRELQSKHISVELVTAEDLIYAQSWDHRVDEDGTTLTRIKLQNGHIISSDQMKCVLNRIRYLSMPHFVDKDNRNYAEMEMGALYISFLKNINDRLIEPIEMRYLSLTQDNTLFYFQKAIETHLPILDYHYTSSPRLYPSPDFMPVPPAISAMPAYLNRSPFRVWQNQPTLFLHPFTTITKVLIIGNSILSEISIPFEKEMRDFVRSIRRTFIELHFAKTREGLRMCHVNIFPQQVRSDIVKSLAGLMIERFENTK